MKKKILSVLLICCVLLTSMSAMADWTPVKYCLRCASPANFVEYRKYSRHVHDLWYRCTSCGLLQSLALEWHTLEHHEGKVPTCTEYGWNAYDTCDACGYTTYESLNKDPNNHDLVEHEGKAPTCMEYGWDAYQTCTRCDYSTYKKLPVQHDLVHHEGKEWSCTESGWYAYDTCKLCDYSTYHKRGPHFGELVAPKEPTCTEIGWRQYIKCSRCDAILANYIELPALGHVPEANKSVVTKPTCTEDGYTTHTCSVCKVTYTADVVKAPGHSYKSVVTEPTCTEDGYTTYTCSVCEYTYTGDKVSNLKHDLEQHEAKAPTCTEIGWEAYETCKNCDYTTYNELPALKHMLTWKSENGQYWQECTREDCDYATAKQAVPTVSIDGANTVCRTQDYTFSFTLPEGSELINAGYEFEMKGCELDTTLENGVYTATLESSAYAADENSVKITVKAKTADDFIVKAEKTVTIQSKHSGGTATCKGKAVCTVCGEEYGELASHELTHIAEKAATAAEVGNTEYWHCDICGKYFSDEDGTNEIELTATVLPKLVPTIIAGNGATVTEGEKKALSFTSDAAFDDFIRVEVDGKTVDESNYTVKSGSAVVTLNADYVSTLSVGEHTLGIVSQSGTATATFTVNKKATETTAQPTTTPSTKPETPTPDKNSDKKSPQTGDSSNLALWIVLLCVSGGAVIGTTAVSKKKKHNS